MQVEQTFQDKLEEVKRMRLQGETRLAAAPVPEGKQVPIDDHHSSLSLPKLVSGTAIKAL